MYLSLFSSLTEELEAEARGGKADIVRDQSPEWLQEYDGENGRQPPSSKEQRSQEELWAGTSLQVLSLVPSYQQPRLIS